MQPKTLGFLCDGDGVCYNMLQMVFFPDFVQKAVLQSVLDSLSTLSARLNSPRAGEEDELHKV